MKLSVSDVLFRHWDNKTLPVSVMEIAAGLRVKVLADPAIETSGHFTPDSPFGGPLITYNPWESEVRQRFTIAHEIGHYCLGHGVSDRTTPPDFYIMSNDKNEVDANKFAAELLMPENAVRALVEVRGIRSLRELAGKFQVSAPAMRYRLKNLGYSINE